MNDALMGWDIGGANLKACLVGAAPGSADAPVVLARWHVDCPLWHGIDALHRALAPVFADCTRMGLRPRAHVATMTGELADAFAHRRAGVSAIAQDVDAAIARGLPATGTGLRFYAIDGVFVDAPDAPRLYRRVASSNWHASARWLATRIPAGVLLDVGSTTTDIVPFSGGRVRAIGASDHERMRAHELVYTGASRTPLMALATQITFEGLPAPLMAERFADTADVYRILGKRPCDPDDRDTADGAGATRDASIQRLARMVGLDRYDAAEHAWIALARAFADTQQALVARALDRVFERMALPVATPVLIGGSGAHVARAACRRTGRTIHTVDAAIRGVAAGRDATHARAVADVLPAYAVAALALQERRP